MSAPWAEGPYKVVVEFIQGGGSVGSRKINLKHSPGVVPPQLQGRVSPAAWQAFMQDVERLAQTHPYVQRPTSGQVCGWVGGFCVGLVTGICCVPSDDYSTWLPQAEAVIAQHRAAFAAGGAHLSLQRAQFSYWIQIDIDPSMAVGQPVAPSSMGPPLLVSAKT